MSDDQPPPQTKLSRTKEQWARDGRFLTGRAARPRADVQLHVLPNPAADLVTPATPRPVGDCVDCTLCVQTCPTGIDIRDGLQMECINCTQCIDACDAVMDRLGRARGLIRYASQEDIEGRKLSWFRPRLAVYPLALVAALAGFFYLLATVRTAEVTFLRARGLPYSSLPSGEIANTLRIKVVNRTDETREYTFKVAGAEGLRLEISENPMKVAPGQMREEPMLVVGPASMFQRGRLDITVTVSDGHEYTEEHEYGLLGPVVQGAPR